MSESISRRQQEYHEAFAQHIPIIQATHRQAIDQLLPQLTTTLALSPTDSLLLSRFLGDHLNTFRFLHRHRFDPKLTLDALAAAATWRLTHNIDQLAPSQLEPIYLRNPLMFFHPQLTDRWGRTTAILNLRHLTRTEDGSLEGLKEFIAWNCELARRSIYEPHRESINQIVSSPSPPNALPSSLQISLIVDLKGASINNLEVELLPYLIHLVKDNFPDMLGAVFILNYGWMYAGMWQVVKRILSQSTLDRILFPSQTELLEFFDRANLLQEHGGLVVHQYDPQHDPFISRFGKPTPPSILADLAPELGQSHHHPESSLSRQPSLESIHDIFFSTVNTPHPQQLSHPSTPNRASGTFTHSHRRPSWLNMTNYHHPPAEQLSSAASFSDALQRNRSKSSTRTWLHSAASATPNFALKLPFRTHDEHDEDASEPHSASSSPSPSPSPSASESLSTETPRRRRLATVPDPHPPHVAAEEEDEQQKDRPIVRFKKRKRDYFCIKLLIKFGYFLRTLQMLFKLLTAKLFAPLPASRPRLHPQHPPQDALAVRDRPRRLLPHHSLRLPHYLHLHHLLLILNLQRRKIISSLGCLFLLLFFFLKKKKSHLL